MLRGYDRAWLRGDVLGGVTVAAYLVPQVMAYAAVAGLPPVTGLWASTGPLLVYAVLGSSRRLSIGPESTTALMTASAVGAMTAGNPERYAATAAALALAVGLVCLLGRLARLGFLADLLSRPVLVGYMAGIAVLMVVSQLGKLTGMQVEGDTPLSESVYVLQHLDAVRGPTLTMALTVTAALLVAQRFRPRWPNPLLAMLLAALVTWVFDLAAARREYRGQHPARASRSRGCPTSPSTAARAGAAGDRRRGGGLLRQRADRPSLRRQAPRAHRRQPGVPRARRRRTWPPG